MTGQGRGAAPRPRWVRRVGSRSLRAAFCAALIVLTTLLAGPPASAQTTPAPGQQAQPSGSQPSGNATTATGIVPPDPATLAAVAAAARGPDIPDIDMEAWERLATRAEDTLDRDAASNEALENLRSEVTTFRSAFLEAQSANEARISTLRSQISALDTGEASGEVPPAVVARRASLEAQLAELTAPVLAAEEAYTRADGIVSEIDRIIRNRQTERLRTLGPSPVNPALWGPAWREMRQAMAALQRETRQALASDVRRQERLANAPQVAFLMLVGLGLLLRGRRLAGAAGHWFLSNGRRGGRVWNFLVSLGEIALPLAGIYALVSGVQLLGLVGIRGQLLLELVPAWATIILAGLWLADRLFFVDDGGRILPMGAQHRREARFYAGLLAMLLVVQSGLARLSDLNGFEPGTDAVLYFPALVMAALALLRLGLLMRTRIDFSSEVAADQPLPMRARFVSMLGQAAVVIAVVSPILAMIGYGALARLLVFPVIATLFVAGSLLVLQRFTSDLYRFATGQGDDEEEGLLPVLIGLALVLLALPVIALIWGARVADLTELWTRIAAGFTIGDTRFQPSDFLVFLLVFLVLYSATRILQATLRNTVLPKTGLDTGGRNAVVSGVGYVGIILAAIVSISATGINLSALAFIFTALSVGIGFGLQNIVQNFGSGIILLIERPIAEGDWIEVGGNMGYVRNISVRSTRIETFDRTDVIIPNGDLISGTVTNYTRGNSIGRVIVPVGVAYGSDTKKVENILLGIAREHDMVLMNPAPAVLFMGFGADSLDFEIRAILRDVNYVLNVKSEMNHLINARFAEAGIEIPFAQRDVWLRNPEALTGAVPPRGGAGAPETANDAPPDPQKRQSDEALGADMPAFVAGDEA